MEFAALRSELEPLKYFRKPWFVAGGWAIDLFVGRNTRDHKDVDVAIFREDQFELRQHLPNWHWEKLWNEAVVPWREGERLELPAHEVHASSGGHRLEFLLNERQGDFWEYRRDRTVVRSISHFQVDTGLPIFPPEVVLLYKSQSPSESDLADFRQAWPRLTSEPRQWLAEAMVKVRPQTVNIVEVVDYDEQWPTDFSRVEKELSAVLDGLPIAIEHVGSTSVRGLAAKPIIDVDVVIRSYAAFSEVRDRLERFGYIHRGALGVEGREAFRRVIDLPKHHLYVCEQASRPLVEHLIFRDHLRNNPEVAAAYASLKKALAQRFRTDRDQYTEAKTHFIRSILAAEGQGIPG
jgi:GrpB-like predicted nucleotidyltransferase (UPF0157 family)